MPITVKSKGVESVHLVTYNGAELHARRSPRSAYSCFYVSLTDDCSPYLPAWAFNADACREAAEFFKQLVDILEND